MYSAKKVKGKKLYELARKGVEIKREPVDIEIYDIKGSLIYSANKPVRAGVQILKLNDVHPGVSGVFYIRIITKNSETYVRKVFTKD